MDRESRLQEARRTSLAHCRSRMAAGEARRQALELTRRHEAARAALFALQKKMSTVALSAAAGTDGVLTEDPAELRRTAVYRDSCRALLLRWRGAEENLAAACAAAEQKLAAALKLLQQAAAEEQRWAGALRRLRRQEAAAEDLREASEAEEQSAAVVSRRALYDRRSALLGYASVRSAFSVESQPGLLTAEKTLTTARARTENQLLLEPGRRQAARRTRYARC